MSVNALRSILKDETDAALISSEINRRYYTAFPATDGYLVVTKNKSVLFADSRYIEAASLNARGCETALLKRFGDSVGAFLAEAGITRLYCECDRLTVSELAAFKKALPNITFSASRAVDKKTDELRAVKTADEVLEIKKAQHIAEAAFDYILGFIKPGVTEREIGLALDFYMLSHGAEALSFETIAVTGAKSSMPHGVPGDVKVKNGDFITMDYGAVVGGYHSDMTRTVAVGKVSAEQKKVYDTVLEAQLAALASLKKGCPCSRADAAARSIITEAGYGEYFGHSTGHGVGVEIHEKPNLSPRSVGRLEVGNVVTVEPGIYLPGKFGVRIEDMALITETGCENLTNAPKELIIL